MASEKKHHLYAKLKKNLQAHIGAKGYSIKTDEQPTCWINFPNAKKMGERSTDYDLAIGFHRADRQMEIRISARKATDYAGVLETMKERIPAYGEQLGYDLSFGPGEPGRIRIFALHPMPLEIIDDVVADLDDYAATVALMKKLFDDFDTVLVPHFSTLCGERGLSFG